MTNNKQKPDSFFSKFNSNLPFLPLKAQKKRRVSEKLKVKNAKSKRKIQKF
jgi:hypothetical protein